MRIQDLPIVEDGQYALCTTPTGPGGLGLSATTVVAHNHDGRYAALTHDHDADYAALTHDHDADYAALTHNHDADYAALTHDHEEFLTQEEIEALPGFGNGSGSIVGSLIMWVGTSAPSGWLLCDGSAISRSTYATLFAIIGESFGIGDGSTTFNLPDFRGRSPVGVGQGTGLTLRNMADSGGAETHTMIASELPSNVMFTGPRMASQAITSSGTSSAWGVGDNRGVLGASIPFSTMSPFLCVNFIIYGGV
jgi:microcystin-dependent protein